MSRRFDEFARAVELVFEAFDVEIHTVADVSAIPTAGCQ